MRSLPCPRLVTLAAYPREVEAIQACHDNESIPKRGDGGGWNGDGLHLQAVCPRQSRKEAIPIDLGFTGTLRGQVLVVSRTERVGVYTRFIGFHPQREAWP